MTSGYVVEQYVVLIVEFLSVQSHAITNSILFEEKRDLTLLSAMATTGFTA